MRRAYPVPVRAQVLRLRGLAGPLLDALDRLPQALSHQDAYSRNLLSRRAGAGEAETVAVDWAFVGPAALGAEAGQLVAASALYLDVRSGDHARLAELVFQGYLDGLADAGWAGDWRRVRLGYLGALLARWSFVVPFQLAWVLDEASHAAFEAQLGLPMAELLEEGGRFVSAQLGALREAEALLRAL